MAARTRERATYNDLLKAPEHLTAELVDGELFLSPQPAGPHNRFVSALGMDIGSAYDRGRGGPGGWWIVDEPEIHFDLNERVVVPDLAGWRRERMPIYPEDHKYTIAPDWICEVLSPSTFRWDRDVKLPLYAEYEVPWVWYVQPVQRYVEIRKLIGGELSLIERYDGNAKFRAEPFMEVEIDLGSIWGSPPAS
jgi:Uma2 family endonuclease